MKQRANMKKLAAIILCIAIPAALAAELPKMSQTNEVKMLRKFPLADRITQQQILDRYGPPSNVVKVLDIESWEYDAPKQYIFKFQNGIVVDVIVKYTGQIWHPRAASACAKRRYCNTKGE